LRQSTAFPINHAVGQPELHRIDHFLGISTGQSHSRDP
jgi:hypothetical protein